MSDAPKLNNDCFALPPGVDWTPVDEALAQLRKGLTCVVGSENMPVFKALGRILAEPVIASRSNPAVANCAVDGYGFAFNPLSLGAQKLSLVSGRSAAGQPFEGAVPKGCAIRILTGAQVPEGVDTVIMEEDVVVADDHVLFQSGLKLGANTRKAGEDVLGGSEIIPAGRRLTPQDLALIVATGGTLVAVRHRLKVGVISTGDELRQAGEPAQDAEVYDANRPMLLAILERWGCEAVDLGAVKDDRSTLRAAFDQAANSVDAIVTSGGASAGDEDHVSALLSQEGNLQNWRIALKPGRPLALALWNGVPVFGLPGNPVAAFVCALIFARPALGVLAGSSWENPQSYQLPASFSKTKKAGRREYLRGRINSAGQIEKFATEGSGRISGLNWADGLIELSDAAQDLKSGDSVTYLPFSSFGL